MSQTARQMQEHEAQQEPLRELLNKVSGELLEISSKIEDVQSLLTVLTWKHASHDPNYISSMQRADLISQELAGLSNFMRGLLQGVPTDWRVDAAEARTKVTLSDLARRL